MAKTLKLLMSSGLAIPLAIELKLPTGVPSIATLMADGVDKAPVLNLPIEVPDLPLAPAALLSIPAIPIAKMPIVAPALPGLPDLTQVGASMMSAVSSGRSTGAPPITPARAGIASRGSIGTVMSGVATRGSL